MSATATPTTVADASGGTGRRTAEDRLSLGAARGALHDVWVIARRGLVHMKRHPEALSDATIQPLMFVLLFAYVFAPSTCPAAGATASS